LWQIADDDGGIGAPIESDSPYHHIVTIPSEEESAMLGKREEAIRNIVGYARELTCLSIVSTSPAVVTTIMTKLGDAINDLDALDAERRKAKGAGNGE